MIMATSTSFRISDAAKTRLASRAAREGMTATALLDQLIVEGIDQLDYPGIVFRGSFVSPSTMPPSTQRRSEGGSPATGPWRSEAAGRRGSVRRCWRDRLHGR